MLHLERHRAHRIGWLRASVLGANDGIVSTASLIVGVAAAEASRSSVLLAGIAGLVAGAMSMAAGEYVSVSSQSDTENADLARERVELATTPEKELDELTQIYVHRGLDEELAHKVAMKLTEVDAIGTHAREELGISEMVSAKPITAALASAGSFAIGAMLPMAVVLATPLSWIVWAVVGTTILFLAGLGALAAFTGGSSIRVGIVRVTFWGVLAMLLTAVVGKMFSVSTG